MSTGCLQSWSLSFYKHTVYQNSETCMSHSIISGAYDLQETSRFSSCNDVPSRNFTGSRYVGLLLGSELIRTINFFSFPSKENFAFADIWTIFLFLIVLIAQPDSALPKARCPHGRLMWFKFRLVSCFQSFFADTKNYFLHPVLESCS